MAHDDPCTRPQAPRNDPTLASRRTRSSSVFARMEHEHGRPCPDTNEAARRPGRSKSSIAPSDRGPYDPRDRFSTPVRLVKPERAQRDVRIFSTCRDRHVVVASASLHRARRSSPHGHGIRSTDGAARTRSARGQGAARERRDPCGCQFHWGRMRIGRCRLSARDAVVEINRPRAAPGAGGHELRPSTTNSAARLVRAWRHGAAGDAVLAERLRPPPRLADELQWSRTSVDQRPSGPLTKRSCGRGPQPSSQHDLRVRRRS